jgi:hypothetical protein
VFGRRNGEAASPPNWSVRRVEQATQSLVCRVRFDPAVAAARASHAVLIWITVEFLQTRRAGQATDVEMARLDTVDETLADLAEDAGLFVATVTGSDVREYLVYARTSDAVDDLRHGLNAAIAPHRASVAVQEDPHWDSYRRLLG